MNLRPLFKSKILAYFASILAVLTAFDTSITVNSVQEEVSTNSYKFSDLKGLKLETERLIITPFAEEDIDKLSEYLLDKDVTRYLDPSPKINGGFAIKEEAQDFLRGKGFDTISTNSLEFTIKLKNSNTPIGKLDLMLELVGDKTILSLGYLLGKDFQGKDYMSEACFELCDRAFNASDVVSMCVACFFQNANSIKLGNKIFDYIEKSNINKKFSRTMHDGIENGVLQKADR